MKKKDLPQTIYAMEAHLRHLQDQIAQAIEILERSQMEAARKPDTLGSAISLCSGSDQAIKILNSLITPKS